MNSPPSILYTCATCGGELEAAADSAGLRTPCPLCGVLTKVPHPEAPRPAGASSAAEMEAERTLREIHPVMYGRQPLLFVLVVALSVCLVGLPILLVWWLRNRCQVLTITSYRTILRTGWLSHRTTEVLHRDVRNLQIYQTFQQRLTRTGWIGISSAGQSGIEISVDNIPHPEKVRRIVDACRGFTPVR